MKEFLTVLLLTGVSFATGHTYYISHANGNDSNTSTQAQSKLTPWKNLPGCVGSQGTSGSGSYSMVAGDIFILYGGDTWPNASLGCDFTAWSGSSSTASSTCLGNGSTCASSGYIYIGVDMTWFTGASWARPIFNGGGTAVGTPTGGQANTFIRFKNYMIFDNIEMTGLFWTGNPNYGTNNYVEFCAGSSGCGINSIVEHLYIHGWSHAAYPTANEHACGIIGDTGIPNNNANSYVYQSVIDGSDTDEASCAAIFGGPDHIIQSFAQYTTDGFVGNGIVLIDGCTFQHIVSSFDPTDHENGIEINAAQNFTVSNTVVAHLGSGALGFWSAPYPGYTATWYNDVLFDTDTGNVFDIAPAVYTSGNCTKGSGVYCTVSGTTNAYNDTIECGPNSSPSAVCFANIDSTVTAATIENVHAITNATSPNGGLWSTNGITPTTATNLVQTLSTANGQGYNESQTYPFSPTSGGSTIGAGTNLTSDCSSFASLCTETAVGVSYNASTHAVSYPNKTQNSRPASGAWDIGAYEYQAGNPNAGSQISAGTYVSTGNAVQ